MRATRELWNRMQSNKMFAEEWDMLLCSGGTVVGGDLRLCEVRPH